MKKIMFDDKYGLDSLHRAFGLALSQSTIMVNLTWYLLLCHWLISLSLTTQVADTRPNIHSAIHELKSNLFSIILWLIYCF